ncbi:MAG: hypothetical protein QY330_02850 [Candidatus Dojkabacteria bacterium]|uniref:Uncharacterized protein n=2 Tax=Candidatus Dojkabacteria TaxID=74243 RepID=A0A136KK47_9BACT|nr:MAG: hypothetical protein UZ20_WS6002000338 [candidate division WS6 bacterium OLB21]MBW7953739.1 hypothetical protein [Candidatus Dojkabacteria bacterium]WKZ27461.1 MAG: hypothetical protein QY330_02850 [Candidatus Dojkabacteria bacterium]
MGESDFDLQLPDEDRRAKILQEQAVSERKAYYESLPVYKHLPDSILSMIVNPLVADEAIDILIADHLAKTEGIGANRILTDEPNPDLITD